MRREYQIKSDGYGYVAQVRERLERRGAENRHLGPWWSDWYNFDLDTFGCFIKHATEGEAQAACDAHETALRRREVPATYTPYTPKVSL
jgi:hypothetical protein